MIWNKEAECMSREQRQKLQAERLKQTVKRCYENVPLYKQKLDAAGIKPEDIKSLDDLQHLPFTTADDLRESYPFRMFAVPMADVARIHSSSGTTGKPKVVGYTRNDINTWAEVMARTIACGGAGKDDIIQNAYGYGLFTGGLGIHYGAEKIGTTVIPISGGNTKRQIMIMADFGPTMLSCTPSYAMHLADTAMEMGVDIRKLPLKYGIFGAEMWTTNMRQQLEEKMGVRATDIYGLTEIIGPGVASECEAQDDLHVFDDHFLPEVIDPQTLKPVPPGTPGEVVFTSLTKEAFPIIRYRTRDMSRLNDELCPCGRTHMKMRRVTGRSDDMLIIRGVNVYPSQVETILLQIDGVAPHYLIVVNRVESLDVMEVQVEITEQIFSDEIKGLEALEKRIRHNLQSELGVSVEVKLVEPKTIERSEGKAKRVLDNRPKE